MKWSILFLLFGSYALATESLKVSTVEGKNLVSGKIESVTLTPANKKGTVVMFLSSECPCSMSHLEHFKTLSKEFPEYQFVGFLSNSDEDPKKAKETFESAGFPVLMDEKAKVADAFKAVKTPHVYIVDAKDKILYQGGASDSSNFPKAKQFYLKTALQTLKEGKPLAEKETKALGCYIRRE